MFKLFNRAKKTTKSAESTAKAVRMYKFVNELDETDIIVTDESGLGFLVYDYSDNYKQVATWIEYK